LSAVIRNGCFALTAQQSVKEPLGCTLIAARPQQNIDDITILIHGTPKILLLAVKSDEKFAQHTRYHRGVPVSS